MVPLVHDIRLIIDRLDTPPPNADALAELTDFASIRRNEEATFEVTHEETTAAIAAVELALAFCESEVK